MSDTNNREVQKQLVHELSAKSKDGTRQDFVEFREAFTVEQMETVKEMLARKGLNNRYSKICDLIQIEWGLLKDKRRDALTRQLQRYRDRYIQPAILLEAKTVSAETSQMVAKIADELEHLKGGIDSMQILRDAILMQYNRAALATTADLNDRSLDPDNRKEVEALHSMAKDMVDLEVKLGLRLSEVPDQSSITINNIGTIEVTPETVEQQTADAVAEASRILTRKGLLRGKVTSAPSVIDVDPVPDDDE